MIIKLVLNSERLDALHKALESEVNLLFTGGDQRYVQILKVKSRKPEDEIDQHRAEKLPVPRYNVTLYVLEEDHPRKTPLSKVARVLAAVDLFPDEGKAPSK